MGNWALQASCVGLNHMVFNSIFKIHHQQLLMRVQKELFEVFSYKIRENEFINWFFFVLNGFFLFLRSSRKLKKIKIITSQNLHRKKQ